MKPAVRSALEPFGVSIFTEINALAQQHQALNLSQGFPDFDGPALILDAAAKAMRDGKNQYAPSHGVAPLRRAIAARFEASFGREIDDDREVTVLNGATEALYSTINAIVEPGDEVVIFEPFYDSYPACTAIAGGVARYVPLQPPAWTFEPDRLRAAVSSRTKLIIVNTPMNPAGKVFTRAELEVIASIAREVDAYVLADEVYEHLVFDDHEHVSIAALEGMWERTITVSSAAKTFSLTGWKIGWAIAPEPLSRALRMSHQFVTFCSATPLQHAIAAALGMDDDYFERFRADYDERRRCLVGHLAAAGFDLTPPQGTYFAIADISPLGFDDDDVFVRHLMSKVGVAAIPVSAFYHERSGGRTLVRFAFCKQLEVLEQAGKRLAALGAGR